MLMKQTRIKAMQFDVASEAIFVYTTMRGILALYLLIAVVCSKAVYKRNNEYGDEPIQPSLAPQPEGGYAEHSVPEAVAVEEEAPKAIEQPAPAEGPAEIEASGYRKKRNNEYGDEPLAPAAGGYAEESAPEVPKPEEQAPSAVEQPTPAEGTSEVEASGYRKKRNNEYGDEPVVPSAESQPAGGYGGEPVPEAQAVEEEAPKAIEQPTPAEGTSEVEASGYRKKRNNEYGDEPLAPAADGYAEESVPKAPEPEEQAPSAVQQPAPAEGLAQVEASGYRKKRNNEYGDEPLAPAAGSYAEESVPEVPKPEEQAASAVEQPTPVEGPAEVEASGYRKKRNNEYGDEPLAPAAGGYAEESVPEVPKPEEQAASAVEQPTPVEGPAEVEASGY
uniref:Pollen-specific leucine-rich repeat extensin-like protein 1 n=1 Tax=Ascaris lumbricoides TaxID=6252 RepID=A0A0M3I7G8_ASCLU